MNFKEILISGEFIKRYKRFFVDVKIGNNIVTAHCPNTGSMMGLLKKGNKVWLSKSDNPKRKLKYTLQIIESEGAKVGINTHLTNKKKYFIEVKNVTLSREKNLAEFPDSITSRGLKHIKELLKANKEGYQIYLLFVIQRDDCNKFRIAKDIDPEYWELLTKAVKKNLKILCYDCKYSSKGIKLNQIIKFRI